MMKLLFDGAFGTYYRRLTGSDEPCESANISAPETVRRIHREYLDAGAQAIKTNTFLANPSSFPDKTELFEIIKAGFFLASKEAGDRAVYADIGVCGAETAVFDYITVSDMFLSLGAKNFLFETLDDLTPVLPAINHIKTLAPDSVIGVSFAVSQDGWTTSGKYYKHLLSGAAETVADFTGLNCLCGPLHMKKLLSVPGLGTKPLCAMPNSGYPAKVNGRLEYRDNPEYFGEALAEIAAAGIAIVGGCCGTSPDHIRAAAERIKKIPDTTTKIPEKATDNPETAKRTPFYEAVQNGKFVIAVEVDPPADCDTTFLINAAAELAVAGADAVTLADSPLANAKADSFLLSAKVKRETGIDVIPHLCCRDRNRIAVKGALLAAASENVGNVLAVTGDGIQSANKADDRSVFSLNSQSLISYINELNSTVLAKRPYFIGAALNVNAVNFDAELTRACQKERNGAGTFFTQAIFTDNSINNLKKAHNILKAPILGGILPVASYKNAIFLNNEVSGIEIPQSFVDSLNGKTPEQTAELSADYAFETINKIKPFCNGLYIMMPLKRLALVKNVINRVCGDMTIKPYSVT